MKPQQVVELCEKILKEHNMGGIVIAMDGEYGYYGLTLSKESLFQWSDDDDKVKLSLVDATPDQVDQEFHALQVLETMLDYCTRAVTALGALLREAANDDEPSPDKNKGQKHYVN